MSYFDPPYGYALRRNGSCLSTETNCNETWDNWYKCCPSAAACEDNCCPKGMDCGKRLEQEPHCANDTATLYRANGSENDSPASGYFCCVQGTLAFQNDQTWVGCADSEKAFNANDSYAAAASISAPTSSSTSTSVTISSTSASTATATSDSDSSSSSSSTNTGAIAGGVVGGVVGAALILALLWFFIHRRRKAAAAAAAAAAPTAPGPHMTGDMGYIPWAQAPQQRIQELDDTKQPQLQPPAPVQELEDNSKHQVHELPASHR